MTEAILFGGGLLVLGVLSVVFPYQVAKFDEAIDAIGAKRRSSRVEPAGWKVWFTRASGVLMVLIGSGLLAGIVTP